MKYGFGVDLGGTTVKIAYFDENGTLISKWEIPTDSTDCGKNILPDIARSLQNYVSEHNIPTDCLLGIGIGVPGPVSDDGVVNGCSNLGWGVFNIHKQLGALTGLAVKAGNDATVAALGECWKGSGAGSQDLLFVTLGTGVGGGLVVGGRLLLGAHGAAGEIGHVVLNREETEPCGCGKYGCAEQYCSATGAVRLAKQVLQNSDEPSVLRERELTCYQIFKAAEEGDHLALLARERYFAYLGEFLASLCCVTNPGRVVLGGGVSKAGQVLIDGLLPYFKKHVFHANSDVDFSIATLGNDAGAYGAFKLIAG